MEVDVNKIFQKLSAQIAELSVQNAILKSEIETMREQQAVKEGQRHGEHQGD